MRITFLFLLWIPVLLFFVRERVTYSQIFAEQYITLTEKMSLFEKHLLPQKKGFVQYE